MARFCFLVWNSCYRHHFLSSARKSFSQLTLSRLLEGWEDTPDLGRAACRRRKEEDHGSPLHNSEIKHLHTRALLHVLSSSVLEIINVLFSYFHSEKPQELPGATKLPQFPVSSYSLHWWQEAPGLLWQALGSSHDVASTSCQVSATCSAWRRQIRTGRARRPLPVGRHVCQPNAELSKLQPFRLELPWNKSVQGMARSWQRAKGAQMGKKA